MSLSCLLVAAFRLSAADTNNSYDINIDNNKHHNTNNTHENSMNSPRYVYIYICIYIYNVIHI